MNFPHKYPSCTLLLLLLLLRAGLRCVGRMKSPAEKMSSSFQPLAAARGQSARCSGRPFPPRPKGSTSGPHPPGSLPRPARATEPCESTSRRKPAWICFCFAAGKGPRFPPAPENTRKPAGHMYQRAPPKPDGSHCGCWHRDVMGAGQGHRAAAPWVLTPWSRAGQPY